MKYTTIYIANDHTGVDYKNQIVDHLKNNFNVIDLGTNSTNSCNYALFAQKLSIALNNDSNALGILLCGTGIGISIAANKIKNIRCALLYNDEVAKLAKNHNNANVIAFGAREMSINEIINRIEIFMNEEFEGGRHQVRIETLE